MKVLPFKPLHELNQERNLLEFIEHAKSKLTLYEDQGGFQSTNWKHKYSNGKTVSMEFSGFAQKGRKTGSPMEQPFLDFARAYAREKQSIKASNPAAFMAALKSIYEGLLVSHGKADILQLDGPALRSAVELLGGRLSAGPLYRAGQQIELLLSWLKDNQINVKIPAWKSPWKRPTERAKGTSHEDRTWQKERLLTGHQLACLADAFSLAKTPRERFFTAQAVLLMCAPSRGGELHYLTTDCLFETEALEKVVDEATGEVVETAVKVLNLRWKAAKGGGFMPKPVHPKMEPTIREAVKRLLDLGEPARKAARWATEHPDLFYRHAGCITGANHREDDPLTYEQFCAAMDLLPVTENRAYLRDRNPKSFMKLVPNTKWIREVCSGKNAISYRDLAAYCLKKYSMAFPRWPNVAEIDVPVSKSLCLIRENELHANFKVKEFSFESPDLNRLNNAMGADLGRIKKDTIFSGLGLFDEDGSQLVITSHQLRVWLSTMAERGEMDSIDLAMFAGRVRIEDNRAYDLRQPEELEEEARKILAIPKYGSGGIKALAAIKVNVPVTFEMLGHRDRPGTAQTTGWGYCEHDWTMSPCAKAGDCATCKEHACIKGMPKTLERLCELKTSVQAEFDRAVEASADGTYGADKWVTFHGKRLAVIQTIITMMEDENVPDGTIIRIPKELDPTSTQIALAERGMKSELIATGAESQGIIDKTQNAFLAILGGVQ